MAKIIMCCTHAIHTKAILTCMCALWYSMQTVNHKNMTFGKNVVAQIQAHGTTAKFSFHQTLFPFWVGGGSGQPNISEPITVHAELDNCYANHCTAGRLRDSSRVNANIIISLQIQTAVPQPTCKSLYIIPNVM